MKLVVTGAGGFLGREFAAAATAAGHEVVALIRPTSDESRLVADCVIRRDIFEVAADDLPEGLDAVVHFATGTSGSVETMVSVAVEGTKRMLELARAAGVPRFVHISSMSVHSGPVRADARGYVLEQRPDLRGAYALAKTRAEEVFADLGRDSVLETIVVRPGLVFGRDMVDVLAGTAVRLPLGVAVGIGRAEQRVPWIDLDDLNELLLGILDSPREDGPRAYEALSEPVPAKRELVEIVALHTGLPRRTLWLPLVVPAAAALAVDALLRRDGTFRTLYAVRRAWRFDPAALDSAQAWRRAGRTPATTLRDSVRRAVTIDPVLDGPLDDEVRARAASILRATAHRRRAGADPRVVLLGAGRIVEEMHAPAIESLGRIEVAAVADPQASLASSVAARLGAPAYSSLAAVPDELVAGATVVVATPGPSHVDLAEQAVDRGASVLIEKPAALSLSEFERLAALETPTTPISVVHNYRLRPAVLRLWEFLLRHDVGPLVRARLRFASPPVKLERARWMRDERRNRVLLYDLGIHFVDVLVQVSGELTSVDEGSLRVSSDGLRTISFAAAAATDTCGDIFVDFDFAGTAPGVRIALEFARAACAVDFFPDGFRVFGPKPNPLDDVGAGLVRIADALRQRARRDRTVLRAIPHRQIYEEHLRRCATGAPSSFGIAGVAGTMRSLELIAERLYRGVAQ